MLSPWVPATVLGVLVLTCGLLLKHRKVPPLPDEAGRVENPFWLSIVGLVALGLFGGFSAFLLALNETASSLAMACMAVLGIVLVQAGCMPCIRYGKSGFTVRTYFGRTHECRWEDIRYIRDSMGQDKWLVTKEKSFFLDSSGMGREFFLLYAAAMAPDRRLEKLPKKQPFGLKSTLPSGTLTDAWLITISTLVMVCIFGWVLCSGPQEESALEARTVTFERGGTNITGEYILHAEEVRYMLRLDRSERAAFEEALRTRQPFHLLVRIGGKEDKPEGRIWRIQDETGHVYLSFARALERERTLGWWMVSIFTAIPIINWAYVALLVQMRKNPDRFDPRLVAWCFRDRSKKKAKGKRMGVKRPGT